MTEQHLPEKTLWTDRALIGALSLAILLPLLGSFGLWDPWETHYGEVGRQITERNDWISSWWGSHWKNDQGSQEGTFFFSKPIFLMWLMAVGLEVLGFTEWGIRLGVMFIAVGAIVMAYSMGERIWGRRVGWLMAFVALTCPFFAFLSRQAQTDMPFVGNMTIGLCFFMMAIYGREREQKASRASLGLTIALLLAVVVPQLTIVWTGLGRWQGDKIGAVGAFFSWGPVLAILYALVLLVIIATTIKGKPPTHRQLHLYGFYVFIGLASLSKGLLGFALPGAFIFFYLLLTGEWRRLKEMELIRGTGIFIVVAFPWYVAMLVRHGNAYFQRFFIHDHFKRLATGVHQIDSGSFEHYVKWMAYGMWPWGSFLPAAVARLLMGKGLGDRSDKHKAALFLVIWLVFTFTLFTLSSTKFHHYIFPAVPAACFLVALLLDDLLCRAERRHLSWALYLITATLLLFVGWDLISEPQHHKNLFTYKYDRKWHGPWTEPMQLKQGIIVAIAALGMLPLLSARPLLRRLSIGAIALSALLMTAWCLYDYMPTLSPTWSQKGVWDRYYERCERTEGPPGADDKKRFCAEQALSYKLNWRGETYYTQNEVIPIREDHEFEHFIKNNKGKTFYAIMEFSRYNGEFQRKIPAEFKGKSCLVDTGNIKFALAEVPCKTKEGTMTPPSSTTSEEEEEAP